MPPVAENGENTERATSQCRSNEAERESTLAQDTLFHEHQHPSDRPYWDAYVHGNATLWQGNNHGSVVNNYYQLPPSQQDKCGILLESVTFDRMDARLRNVAIALPNTCKWLLCHGQFAVWVDENQMQEHHGFLWVKGKPGSGKSTIMKEAVAWAERTWSTQIILTYFFNARSPNELEKSSLGLYRSLVYQLLSA